MARRTLMRCAALVLLAASAAALRAVGLRTDRAQSHVFAAGAETRRAIPGEYADIVAKTPGLVAWYRFEGDFNDAAGAAAGKAMGGDPAFVPGPGGGKAVRLTGKRFITMGAAPRLDTPRTSVELWFKPTFDRAQYNPCIVAKRAAGNQAGTRFSIHVWGDYSCLAVWNGREVIRFAPALGQIRQGEWHYLVVTSTDRRMRMYLDGVPCVPADSGAVFTAANKDLPLQIASSTPNGQEYLDCEIDELAVYSRVLTPEEIARHADAMGWSERRKAVASELARRKARAEERRTKRLAELTDEKRLFGRGETATYRDERLTGISLPVGGIGTGVIQMDGQARPAVWQIFNNHLYVRVPHSFLAVRAAAGEAEPVVRALQTEAVGPFQAMSGLSFQGEYPFGWYVFEDAALPVQVRMEVFNPLIPLDVKNSGIPCALFNVTARNPGKQDAKVGFLYAQQNAVGYTGRTPIAERSCKEYGKNVNTVLAEDGAAVVHMTGTSEKTAAGFGDMTISVLAASPSAAPAWSTLQELAADFAADGSLAGEKRAGPSPDRQTLDAAVAAQVVLRPGEEKTVTFVLTWYFPNCRGGKGAWGGAGNRYQNWWTSALDVARYVHANVTDLTEKTRLYHRTLYASNLPWYVTDRIASQVAVLRSRTCFWTKDAYFGAWEGCCPDSGCCHGNCSHVWHYAQSHARLFPEVARRMREQEFRYQEPSGSIPFRQPKGGPATDGQCGTVLNSYREHLMSADGKWLKANWHAIRKAMDFIITTWDADEDGVMDGRQWNTLDCAIDGSSSWLASLYLAALGAAEKMADLQGEDALAARYRAIRVSGMKKQNETLFNGEYYFQLPGKTRLRDYLTGCHIDQVLGQWWGHQLDLGWLYPRPRVRTALRSLVKYNFRYDFHGVRQAPRKFVADEDAGMQMITWPKAGRPPAGKCMLYGDEVMTGFEYAAAAAMIQAGLLKEGFMITRAVHDRYDGRKRTNVSKERTASWGWTGNPFGDDECGKFYARAMSNWSILLACQGCVYDGPAGLIGFEPVWQPQDHRSFFTAAEGWGLYEQRRNGRTQTHRIDVRFGKLRVRALVFELPENATLGQATVSVAGRQVRPEATHDGRRVTLTLPEPATVIHGQRIETVLTW